MTQPNSILIRNASLAACAAMLFATQAQGFDPFDDPNAPFAPVLENVAKEGVTTGNIGAARWPLQNLPQISNFRVVAHHKIPNPNETAARGRNGFLAIASSAPSAPNKATCAYVGNRIGTRTGTGDSLVETDSGQFAPSGRPALPPEFAILDISDPTNPVWMSAYPMVLGSQLREGRSIPSRYTLIVQNFSAGTDNVPGPNDDAHNNLQIFDITDCLKPKFVQQISFGAQIPHEFFVW